MYEMYKCLTSTEYFDQLLLYSQVVFERATLLVLEYKNGLPSVTDESGQLQNISYNLQALAMSHQKYGHRMIVFYYVDPIMTHDIFWEE